MPQPTKHLMLVDGVPRNEYTKRPDQRAKRKAYADAHKDEHTEYSKKYRRKYPERTLFRAARTRSKIRNLEFNLDYSDVVIPEYCPILGIKIEIYAGNGRCGGYMNSPSLDRIDNTKGYIKGNVQVISHKANSMKFTASKEELLKFAQWVLKEYT